MQDIHSIGGGGRLFGVGDRRLRPHHQNQALKCPRCDSLNTKFCYYNNYNLSQPRHFCKSCRRYWTKGGILRNVPVGGGCRKTKRCKPKQSSEAPRERKSNYNSSSESSSLTATTLATATTTAATTDTGSASFNFSESRFFVPQSTNTNFEYNASDGTIFPEIGSFTNLMTASSDPTALNFDASEISPFRWNQQQNHTQQLNQNQQQWQLPKMPTYLNDEMTAGYLDQTVPVGLPRSSNGEGFAPFDWQAGGDQGLFEFTSTVDQSYWNQNQWSSDLDHSYLLISHN